MIHLIPLNLINTFYSSAILFFCFPEQYTVMDYRAWDTLKALNKINGEIGDTFECWQKSNEICREIAKQNGVSLRKLDKALWQFQGSINSVNKGRKCGLRSVPDFLDCNNIIDADDVSKYIHNIRLGYL